jgi:uncharacterized phage protein gp47/JayE
MADLATRLDYYALGRDYVLQRAKKIDPTQVDVEGSDVNIFVGSTSVVADAVTGQLAESINRLLLDGAQDDDLDRYALDRYNLPRKGASPAVGSVRFFRVSAAGGAGNVPIGTRLKTAGNVEYITTTLGVFGIGTLDTGDVVNVRAVQAGKVTQVGTNTIRSFSQPGLLFDQTLQVTNDLATAGGEDVEDDETFRARIRDFWNTARRGILAAISFGALSVPGVVSAQAVEVVTTGGQPARVVNLYIADSSGVASKALGDLVRVALDDFRAAGIAVIISTSIPLLVSVSLSLQFQAGVDTGTIAENVRAAVVEFINSLPVNGTLYIAQLYSVLQRFVGDGLIPNASSVASPAGDLVPPVGQTIRTQENLVTVNGS